MSAGTPPGAREIERTILRLLDERDSATSGKTICPSDAARALDDDFRPLMEPVRAVAWDLVDRGVLQVMQSGRVVDPRIARGAIRLRRPPAS